MTVRPAAAGVPHLLVVEDEPSFSDALAVGFAREGFRVTVAADGAAALEEFRRDPPDIVLLDVMLPKLSGLDVCRIMRATSSVPIIMVTARSEEVDAVVGLEVGADDYVTKPYRLRELVARVRANLRRLESRPQGERDLPVEVVRVREALVEEGRRRRGPTITGRFSFLRVQGRHRKGGKDQVDSICFHDVVRLVLVLVSCGPVSSATVVIKPGNCELHVWTEAQKC